MGWRVLSADAHPLSISHLRRRLDKHDSFVYTYRKNSILYTDINSKMYTVLISKVVGTLSLNIPFAAFIKNGYRIE